MLLFILIICLVSFGQSFLHNNDMALIRRILQNPDYSIEAKYKTREILATHFIPLALKEFTEFTKRNRKYIKNVDIRDLRQYAILGLCSAAKNYDGTSGFYNYSKKYILGELHRGLTLIEPLKPRTTIERLNGKSIPTIIWGNSNDEWLYSLDNNQAKKNTISSRDRDIERTYEVLNNMEPFYKRLFYYKYCSSTLREIRSTYDVCELMVISNETYRKKMKYIIEEIKNAS